MAFQLSTCIGSWRGHLKHMSLQELVEVQDIALPALVFVRNLDQSNVLQSVLNSESWVELKDRTQDAVNVLIKAHRLATEHIEAEARQR